MPVLCIYLNCRQSYLLVAAFAGHTAMVPARPDATNGVMCFNYNKQNTYNMAMNI